MEKDVQDDLAEKIKSGKITVKQFMKMLEESEKRLTVAANKCIIELLKLNQ